MLKKTFKQDEIICRENLSGDEMYIIKSGSVRVFKTINAEEIGLAVLKKNDFFGELCLLLGGVRSATVKTLEKTELLVIKKDSFIKSLQENPDFQDRFIKTLAKRLLEAHGVISNKEGEIKSLEIMYGVK